MQQHITENKQPEYSIMFIRKDKNTAEKQAKF